MERSEAILLTVIDLFSETGLDFTMDDVAKRLHMSKKTLYKTYESKEEMFLALADYCFADIKHSEKQIARDTTMDIVEKIEKIIVVLPERYRNIGLQNLYRLKDQHPLVYERIATYLETDWDMTIALLNEGMSLGRIKPISIPILKAMVEGTIQHYLSSNILSDNGIGYEDGLLGMIRIIIKGIEA